ncbi:MAG: polysaccharide deacetylase family protein [Verrucomicrobia bacterium]|nr:polysaccharide deacetylase family protein [Verrucomicrobiota bacterium]MBU1735884.1 polysaccharide deacetylase family protein [Verrucomicrobiota bacterium]MBU1855929.1 polysaccharide deacetylase family protein [Verrucomicrobiota bacterium]
MLFNSSRKWNRAATRSIPFQERKSPLRGILDLAAGRYPRFLFGGGLSQWLPVFHFHETHPKVLEPYFQYLAENGYRTVTSDQIAAFVLRGVHPGPKSVALCFDDAWSSLWVFAAPLLRKYDLQAIAYVSPDRVPSAPVPRRQWDGTNTPDIEITLDRTEGLFATWSELRVMHESGHLDIQAHSWRHAMVFASDEVADFIQPRRREHPHAIPLVDTPAGLRFAAREDLGAPLYATRSRLSDVRRWIAPDAFDGCIRHVQANGGASFFQRETWQAELRTCVEQARPGQWESEPERNAAIREELARARARLEAELGKQIHHMCFPWAIAGKAAVRLAKETGYQTAFADRLWGARAVRPGDPPHQLMRLKHPLICCLPGKQRTWFFGRKPNRASHGLELGPIFLPTAPNPP